MQFEQIRGALPRTVTPVSLRYPQLLCVLSCFGGIFATDDMVRNDRSARATRHG
jgi:hypothetical protein